MTLSVWLWSNITRTFDNKTNKSNGNAAMTCLFSWKLRHVPTSRSLSDDCIRLRHHNYLYCSSGVVVTTRKTCAIRYSIWTYSDDARSELVSTRKAILVFPQVADFNKGVESHIIFLLKMTMLASLEWYFKMDMVWSGKVVITCGTTRT